LTQAYPRRMSATGYGRQRHHDTRRLPQRNIYRLVFYIAPAETNTGGVITYLIKIAFSKADPRLKSGSRQRDIQTKHDDTAFILPQYAILQNDSGTFVETLVVE